MEKRENKKGKGKKERRQRRRRTKPTQERVKHSVLPIKKVQNFFCLFSRADIPEPIWARVDCSCWLLLCRLEKKGNRQTFKEMKSILGKMGGRSKSPHVERPQSRSAIEKSKDSSKKGKHKAANEDAAAKSKSSKEPLPTSEPEPLAAPPRNGLSGPRTSTANEAHMFFDLEDKQKEHAPASLTVEDVCETKEEGFSFEFYCHTCSHFFFFQFIRKRRRKKIR
jgi:hypothetical protein